MGQAKSDFQRIVERDQGTEMEAPHPTLNLSPHGMAVDDPVTGFREVVLESRKMRQCCGCGFKEMRQLQTVDGQVYLTSEPQRLLTDKTVLERKLAAYGEERQRYKDIWAATKIQE